MVSRNRMGSCPTIPITVRSHWTFRLYEEERGGGKEVLVRYTVGRLSVFLSPPPLCVSPFVSPSFSFALSVSLCLCLSLSLSLFVLLKLTFTFRSRMLMPSMRTAPGSSKPPSGIALPALSSGAILSLPFFSFLFLPLLSLESSPPLAA